MIFWAIEFISIFIEILMCNYFCSTFITKENADDTKDILEILTVIAAAILFASNRISIFDNGTIIMLVILCIGIQCFYFKEKYFQLIGLVIAYVAILTAIDYLMIYLVALVGKINTIYILGNFSSYIRHIWLLLSKSILTILVLTTNRLVTYKKTIPPVYVIVMGVCSVFLLISNLVLIKSQLYSSDGEIDAFTAFFFVASLGIELIIFWLVIKISEGYEQKQANLLIELNNKMLQKSLDETEKSFELWRQSIHDYKNNIIALTQLANEGNIEDVKKYLQKENELLENKMFYIKTGNSIVDTIINIKQNIAEQYNIVYVVNARLTDNIIMDDIDMANVLGNLLDNAIEASREEEAPYIEINIKQEKTFLIINVKNKCTQKINMDRVKTNKNRPEFHGIGLGSIKRTIKKYKGELIISKEEEEFIVNIMIHN